MTASIETMDDGAVIDQYVEVLAAEARGLVAPADPTSRSAGSPADPPA